MEKKSGSWRGIAFDNISLFNELKYVHIEYAGGQAILSDDRGAVTMWANTQLTMENCRISNSASYGLQATRSNTTVTLANNVFTENNIPMRLNAEYVSIPSATDTYRGNLNDYIEMGIYTSNISSQSIMRKLDVPYHFITAGTSRINISNRLVIEPGVQIRMGDGSEWFVNESGGILIAIGTPNDPIVFSGLTATAGLWHGVYIYSESNQNEIAYAEFRDSGASGSSNPKEGTIRVDYNSTLNIHDVTFKNTIDCGIVYMLLSSQTSNPALKIEDITVDPGSCVSRKF